MLCMDLFLIQFNKTTNEQRHAVIECLSMRENAQQHFPPRLDRTLSVYCQCFFVLFLPPTLAKCF